MAEGSGPLVALTLGALGLFAVSLVLQADRSPAGAGRLDLGQAGQVRVSVALNAATLAVLLRWFQPLTRGVRRAVGIIVGLFALELVIISVQAARGVPSHFNASTPLDQALFGVMGTAIAVVWGAFVYLTWRTFRQRFERPALGWGIRMGLVALVIGSGLGFAMPRPTPAQLESLQAGRPTPASGRTRWACPTAVPACRSPAGAPREGTCAIPTSSACTGCSSCRCWAGS